MHPSVTRRGLLDMQVCVPDSFTDEEVEAFANRANPAGTQQGWKIVKAGSKWLGGYPERNPCACGSRAGCVHILLEC